jgi:hypothetical protein
MVGRTEREWNEELDSVVSGCREVQASPHTDESPVERGRVEGNTMEYVTCNLVDHAPRSIVSCSRRPVTFARRLRLGDRLYVSGPSGRVERAS